MLECNQKSLEQGSANCERRTKDHQPTAADANQTSQPNVHSSLLDNLQRLYQPSPRQRDQTQPLTICFVAEPREKLCQSAPQLPAGSASTLVEGAIAVAHSRIAGAPQLLPTNISITQCSDPSQVFLLAGLPIDSQISLKIKKKIWNEEFVDFGSLLSNPGQDKYQISVQNSTAGNPASFCLEPVVRPKKIISIDVWQEAFHIFVGVYMQRNPHEAPSLMKYGQIIRDLAIRGQNWHFYDKNFCHLHQTQASLVPWVQYSQNYGCILNILLGPYSLPTR